MGRATRWLKGLFGIKIKEKAAASGGGSLCHNPTTIPPNITPAEAAWLRSFYSETDKEQNKHAIAVAAATAAAADAAVAAAQAAVAVVRLTSQDRGTTSFSVSREIWAAVKIQAVFRGYLARKALRALKGLVKIQALVRGFLVRKQAAATLLSMQALIRAQASVRAQKIRIQARISMEKYEDPPSLHLHSRRLSSSFESAAVNINSYDESPKIVEVDTGSRPKSRSRRTNSWMQPEPGETINTISSPFQHRIQTRIATPDTRNNPGQDWEECHTHFSTAHSTPRFTATSPCGCNGTTPAKSVCAESYFRPDSPNYMAKTQSFKAKLRSHSAPKQRPEPGPKRRLSLHELMESRNSLSGARMQRSCSQAINFKNAVMGKLGRSSDFVTDYFYPN